MWINLIVDGNLAVNRCYDEQPTMGIRCGLIHHYLCSLSSTAMSTLIEMNVHTLGSTLLFTQQLLPSLRPNGSINKTSTVSETAVTRPISILMGVNRVSLIRFLVESSVG